MIPIRAYFNGVQEFPGHPSIALWTILEPIAGHPAGSTVSEQTLSEAGRHPVEVSEEVRL